MKHRVLESFYYALDGRNAVWLEAGSSQEIRDEHVDRFVGEGKIERQASVRNLDGTPLERDADGMIAGEPLDLTDEERAALPALDPSAEDRPEDRADGQMRRGRKP